MSQGTYKILCFGDSNTWGYIPGTQAERYDQSTRWPGVLQHKLGPDYQVVEEALNGRTTVWDDPMKPDRNGLQHLPILLESHTPIDLVILALGVNDLKHHFKLTAIDVALGLQTLASRIQQSSAGPLTPAGTRRSPSMLMLSPPPPVEPLSPLGHKFDGAPQRSTGIDAAIAEVAQELGCQYLDAGKVASSSKVDGIHLDEQGHAQLGAAISDLVLSTSLH